MGLTAKGVEADVHGDTQKLVQATQTVLNTHGLQPTVSSSLGRGEGSSGEQIIDGHSGIHAAHVRIIPNGPNDPNTSHIEVTATEGKLCWNMDYAGQILQDIVLSK